MTATKSFVFRFGDIEVREREFCIVKAGKVLAVEPKTFQVLLYMLRSPQKLVSKEELLNAVWGDTSVTENSLPRNIAKLRRLLDDDAREPRYIATVATVGYRFVCEVEVAEDVQGNLESVDARNGSGGIESTKAAQSERVSKDSTSPVLTDKEPRDSKIPLQTPNQRNWRDRKLLFACIAAALLLLLAGGILRRNFTGNGTVPGHGVQPLAMEQRLTANASDASLRSAVVSPDGKYVAYADLTGLYLRQISSGETRRLSLPKGFKVWACNWFPDGTHLLVMRIARQPQDFCLWKPILYKLSILGGDPQEVMKEALAGYVSPDGSRIAYVPNLSENEMWMMDTDGANPRKVVSSGEEKKYGSYTSAISPVAWSPTGQHLAYIENHDVEAPYPAQPTRLLRIIGANGEGKTVVLDDPRIGEALWWGPDGRILFSYREDPASGQDNFGVYSIRFDERTGKAAGPPHPITQAEGRIGGMSGTADGKRLVVLRSNRVPQVFIASRDAVSHQLEEPRRLTLDDNFNIADSWTADSKAVLFVSNRNGIWKLFKQNINETTPEELAEGRHIATPRLSPDGSQVIYLSLSNLDDPSLPASLISKPLAGGAARTIVREKGIIDHHCARAPSTLCVFIQVDGKDTVIRSFDLEHGAGPELARIPDWSGNTALSPDGSTLAIFLGQHRMRFVALGTGAAHDVTVKEWSDTGGDWAADSKTVVTDSSTADGLPVVLEVDQKGKAKVVLRGRPGDDFEFEIQSPDGRHVLVLELIPSDSNAWMVKDF
jgi:DNA-binding winged helix-turn-helix (wHTH) protein/Tol biopolymer transport system component